MVKYISWSAYRTYRDCSLRYENIYITKKKPTMVKDDYNLIYGSTIHEVVEAFYKQKLWQLRKDCGKRLSEIAASSFSKILRDSSVLWNKPKRKTPEGLLDEVLADVPKILDAVKRYKLLSNVALAEYNLRATLSTYKIGGRLDLLLKKKEGLTLLDGKGSKNKQADHREQVLFYVLCYYLANKTIPKFSGVWYFRQASIDWFPFKLDDLKRLRDMVLKACKLIKQGVFKATEKRENCFWCEYKNTCLVQKDHLETPYGEIIEAFL